jgi:hypothetical protein
MEWHLKQIPKILHCYWGGGVLPYIRYMTVKTFIKHNPDWQVMFWYPKYPTMDISWETQELDYKVDCVNCLPLLLSLPITKIPVDFESVGFFNNASEAHKFDFLKHFLCFVYGGVISDMDILYFRPMEYLKINTPENSDKENFLCWADYGFSNGFNIAKKGSKLFEKTIGFCQKEYDPANFQCIGPWLFDNHYPNIEAINSFSPTINIGMDAVYAHNNSQTHELIDGSKPRFADESVGCHWYAGKLQWGPFLNQTNGGHDNLPDCIISNLLKQ